MSEKETFAYLTFPKIAPEKVNGDYLQSKLEEQTVKKYLPWDCPRSDPQVNFVAAERDLRHAELELIEKKKEAITQKEQLDLQWIELDNEALQLRQKFCDFDKMIKENTQKRERAITKADKQTTIQTDKDKAIKDVKEQLKKLSKIHDGMENQIRDHSIYEEYLQMVADKHPEYETSPDVFNKFGALDEARSTLTERMEDNLTTLENCKDEMLQLMKSQNSALIGMNNRVNDLYNRYAAAKGNAQKWEEIVQRIQNESGEKLIEILNVRKSCWNIYLEMCKRRKVKPQFNKSDFENHLWYIRKTMLKLKRTIEIARQKSTTEVSSTCVERPKSKRRI